VQKGMSALPPIATAKADFRKRSCLLNTRKRTSALHSAMSALGQKRLMQCSNWDRYSITSSARASTDDSGVLGPMRLT
jgi:hypothetical protein